MTASPFFEIPRLPEFVVTERANPHNVIPLFGGRRIQPRKQASRRISNGFKLFVGPFVAFLNHGSNHDRGSVGNVRNHIEEIRNV